MQAIRARVGPLISRAQNTVEPAYRWTESMTSKHYEQLMKENSQYVVKDKAAADKLLKQYIFTTLSRIPEGMKQNTQELGQVRSKLSNISQMDLKEVGTWALFAGELWAWATVGIFVGRGFTLGGYNI